jgi:DNA helicase-2/ATP-dependent DNA helicase PcrA
MAYLRLVANPYDAISLQRVINVPPRGLGAKTVAELGRWARALGVPPWEALLQAVGKGLIEDPTGAPKLLIPFAGRAKEALRGFLDVLEELHKARGSTPLPELVSALLDRTGYAQFLRDGTEEGEERWANVVELRNKAKDYEDLDPDVALQRFLEEVSLIQDVDSLEAGEADAVTLITLHAAKGLEFPEVFILGVEEGLTPHIRSFEDPNQMEEERRLFYVGVTRAMRSLYLTYATRRAIYGGTQQRDPSRFLNDVPVELLEVAAPRTAAYRFNSYGGSGTGSGFGSRGRDYDGYDSDREEYPVRRPSPPARAYRIEREYPEPAWQTEPQRDLDAVEERPAREPAFRKGDAVAHQAFGEGVVLDAKVVGADEQVTVLFKGHPTPKKLSLSFAPLQRV